MKQKIFVRSLLENIDSDLRLRIVAGESGVDREIPEAEINRPGLSLSGFFDFFAYNRIQIFGKGEMAYLKSVDHDREKAIYNQFFSYDILCCIFTHGDQPSALFLEYANERGVPVMVADQPTTRFVSHITHMIAMAHAPTVAIHGTLVDVFGLGVLLLGKSGVGKSETALELIERGHRLVADDIVEIRKVDDLLIMGSGSNLIKHHIEIRGLGILNIREIYGIRSVRNRKRIELVASLEDWVEGKVYDRLGIDEGRYNILDVEVPHIIVPVRPGRNIPVIVETAALNLRLKKMGVNSARELDQKLQDWMKSGNV
ncbi:MAG: HPr(Ser) kinase/phosphatase [Spirochaetota bacterium]